MPRATYKPFTAYEEVVGYRGAKRNAFLAAGVFFSALSMKMIVAWTMGEHMAGSDISGVNVQDPEAHARAMRFIERQDQIASSLNRMRNDATQSDGTIIR